MFNLVIVGRSNVGKTSLFNLLTNTNYALVSDCLNSTLDFNYGLLSFNNKFIICVDTCSFSDLSFLKYLNKKIDNYFNFLNSIQKKYVFLLKNASLICLLIDFSVGVLFEDIILTNFILKLKKNNVIILINKIDKNKYLNNFSFNFYSLGVKNLYFISVSQNIGIKEFIDNLFESEKYKILKKINVSLYFNMLSLCINLNSYYYLIFKLFSKLKNKKLLLYFKNSDKYLNNIVKIIIIGKPNVGKSTFFNFISKSDVSFVSNVSGTTKDFIFYNFYMNNKNYVIVDTPGIFKKKYKKYFFFNKEFLCKTIYFKILLFIVDITEGLSKYDLNLLNLFLNKGKLLILIFNKCDKIYSFNKEIYKKELFIKYNFMRNIYIFFISAIKLDYKFIFYLFNFIDKMYNNVYLKKINSSKLTKILIQATNFYSYKNLNNLVKLKYAHIGGYYPFTIIIHGNKINLISNSYKQYLINFFMKYLNLFGLKINLKFKEIFNPFKKIYK